MGCIWWMSTGVWRTQQLCLQVQILWFFNWLKYYLQNFKTIRYFDDMMFMSLYIDCNASLLLRPAPDLHTFLLRLRKLSSTLRFETLFCLIGIGKVCMSSNFLPVNSTFCKFRAHFKVTKIWILLIQDVKSNTLD